MKGGVAGHTWVCQTHFLWLPQICTALAAGCELPYYPGSVQHLSLLRDLCAEFSFRYLVPKHFSRQDEATPPLRLCWGQRFHYPPCCRWELLLSGNSWCWLFSRLGSFRQTNNLVALCSKMCTFIYISSPLPRTLLVTKYSKLKDFFWNQSIAIETFYLRQSLCLDL